MPIGRGCIRDVRGMGGARAGGGCGHPAMDGSSGRATGGAAAATTGRGGRTKRWQAAAVELRLRLVGPRIRSGARSPAGPMGTADRVCCTVPAGCWPQPPGGVPSRGPQRPAAADQIYDSVDALAHAMQTRLPTLAAPRPILLTPPGPRQVSIMLDTGVAPWQRHDPSY